MSKPILEKLNEEGFLVPVIGFFVVLGGLVIAFFLIYELFNDAIM